MQKSRKWLKLLKQKGKTRSSTGVVIIPGMIPSSCEWQAVIKLFEGMGDVWLLSYPESVVDQTNLLQEVTERLKRLNLKKIVFVGISFGGTVAYLLMRYWKKHKVPFEVGGFLAVSAPFRPDDLTFRSQVELALGWGLDRYAKRALLELLTTLRIFWSASFGLIQRGLAENSVKQMFNGIRQGYILRNEWIVQKRFIKVPALLLNVFEGRKDSFVRQSNEISFREIFRNGVVVRGLRHHANLYDLPPATRRLLGLFLKAL